MLNDPMVAALEKAMSGSAVRHKALLNNIANINTPGFKRSEVNFKSELAEVFRNTNLNNTELLERIERASPNVTTQTNISLRNDGNNVDIDREMSTLAQNSMEYEYYISMLAKRLSIIKTVVNEGRK